MVMADSAAARRLIKGISLRRYRQASAFAVDNVGAKDSLSSMLVFGDEKAKIWLPIAGRN